MRSLFFVSLLLTACSAYDPKLGAKPFLCGTSEPKCPDGYECKDDGTGVVACIIQGPGPSVDGSSGDMGPAFNCADDSVLEGGTKNDTVATSSATPVASQRPSITFAGLAICPDGDKDTYRIDITASGQNLKTEITYDDVAMGGVSLSVSILNSGGTPIANGSPMGGNKVGVTAANLPMASSPYYVQVFGPVTGKNNYKLLLEVSGP